MAYSACDSRPSAMACVVKSDLRSGLLMCKILSTPGMMPLGAHDIMQSTIRYVFARPQRTGPLFWSTSLNKGYRFFYSQGILPCLLQVLDTAMSSGFCITMTLESRLYPPTWLSLAHCLTTAAFIKTVHSIYFKRERRQRVGLGDRVQACIQ